MSYSSNGRIHLTSLALLRDYLTDDNHVELLREASGKTKAQLLQLLAGRAPRPDVPSRIRKLVPQPNAVAAGPTGSLEPRSLSTYRLQLNTSEALKQKLELAAKLMTHSNPSGDLAVVVERGLDLLIEQLQKDRFGKTSHPRRRPGKPGKAHGVTVSKPADCAHGTHTLNRRPRRRTPIPREVLRQLVARDGVGCTYVAASGHRCGEQAFLQIHHEKAWARGGSDELDNLRLLCAAHNRLLAEQEFGIHTVQRAIGTTPRAKA